MKKKAKKKPAKAKPAKKKPAKKKPVPKKPVPKKKVAKKKAVAKKPAVRARTKSTGRKAARAKASPRPRKRARGQVEGIDIEPFTVERVRLRPGGQSGDLQGLSNREGADSESVDELLEEGNAFEADVIQGVEDAGADGVREVHTHEVPEDDVPEEYLDEE